MSSSSFEETLIWKRMDRRSSSLAFGLPGRFLAMAELYRQKLVAQEGQNLVKCLYINSTQSQLRPTQSEPNRLEALGDHQPLVQIFGDAQLLLADGDMTVNLASQP